MAEKIVKYDNMRWMPVRTKPRQEKKLAAYCQGLQIECYLPLIRRRHKYKKSKAEFTLPMFPGYIFCPLNDKIYSQILHSGSVLFNIKLDDYQEEILIRELNSIKVIEELANAHTVTVKPEIEPGVPVTITSGPFKGIEGIVSFRKNHYRVVVNIDMLGQSVATECDVNDVEKES